MSDVVYCGPASLRFVGEMPLLYIKGSPHERGYQYGTLLKDWIRRSLDLRYHVMFNVNGEFEKETKDRLFTFAKQNVAQFPEEMLQMFHGMSEGTGGKVTYEECYILNSAMMIEIPRPGSCSSFTKVLADGTFIYCHQADFVREEMYYDAWMVIVEENEKGQRMALNAICPGGLLPQNGMNDRGICLGGADRFPFQPLTFDFKPNKGGEEGGHSSPPPFYYFRICLENASTLAEAKKMLPGGGLLASGMEKKSSVCEQTSRCQGCLDAPDGFIFATNSYVNENCKEDEGSLFGSSYNGVIQCARYRRYEELLKNCNTIEDAAAILRDGVHYYSRIKSWGETFGPIDYRILPMPIPWKELLINQMIDDPFFVIQLASDTISNPSTQHSSIMVPEKGLLYVNSGGSFCSLKAYYGIYINGEANDDWNRKGPIIAASPDVEKARNYLLYNREMVAASGSRKISMDLCRKYAVIVPDAPVYKVSLACWQHVEDPRLALETATKLLEGYPGHYDLVRLIPRIRISLFMKTQDIKLLESNEKELRPYLLKKEEHHDLFIADVSVILMKSLALAGNKEKAYAIYLDLEKFLMSDKYAKNKVHYRMILDRAKERFF